MGRAVDQQLIAALQKPREQRDDRRIEQSIREADQPVARERHKGLDGERGDPSAEAEDPPQEGGQIKRRELIQRRRKAGIEGRAELEKCDRRIGRAAAGHQRPEDGNRLPDNGKGFARGGQGRRRSDQRFENERRAGKKAGANRGRLRERH
jgi:hypothetical protein